jgi:hypothetical protein
MLCCRVQVEASETGWSLVQRSPTVCLNTIMQKARGNHCIKNILTDIPSISSSRELLQTNLNARKQIERDRGRSSSLLFWSPTENSPDDKPDFRKQLITVAGVSVSQVRSIYPWSVFVINVKLLCLNARKRNLEIEFLRYSRDFVSSVIVIIEYDCTLRAVFTRTVADPPLLPGCVSCIRHVSSRVFALHSTPTQNTEFAPSLRAPLSHPYFFLRLAVTCRLFSANYWTEYRVGTLQRSISVWFCPILQLLTLWWLLETTFCHLIENLGSELCFCSKEI